MLGLGQEIRSDGRDVGGAVGQDEALGRTRRQVDADLAHDLDLGGGDPGAPGPDDQVDGLQALVGEAVGQRADRLDAARDEERVDAQQARGPEQHRVHVALAVRRARHDHAADAGDARRHDAHDERRRVRRGAAGGIDADARDGQPAALELHAGQDRRP